MEAVLEFITSLILRFIEATGYFGIFALMALESANIPIPSEIIMPFSGFLAAQGSFLFWPVVLVGAAANLAGSLFSYWLGFLVRKNILHWNAENVANGVQRARRWIKRFGIWAAFISRILPVVRTFISFPLGILGGLSIFRFSILTFAGSLIWSWLLTWVGFKFGENWHVLVPFFRQFDFFILASIVIVAGLVLWRHWQQRRFLSGTKA